MKQDFHKPISLKFLGNNPKDKSLGNNPKEITPRIQLL